MFREFLSENFVGDLEYHPPRRALSHSRYDCSLLLGLSPSEIKFTVIPLVSLSAASLS